MNVAAAIDAGMQPVSSLPGVGPALQALLQKLGLEHVQDLWFHLPLRYEDRTRVTAIADLRAGQSAHFLHFSDLTDEGLLAPLRDADLVLVDAPCSGSGTWRRHPEEAHRLTEDEVRRLHVLQVQILNRAATCVKPGGRLVYVTCSVLDDENAESADAFAAGRPEFAPLDVAALTDARYFDSTNLNPVGHRLSLSPHKTRTDGFFLSAWQRK